MSEKGWVRPTVEFSIIFFFNEAFPNPPYTLLKTCVWNDYESLKQMSTFVKKLNYFQFFQFHIWVYLMYSSQLWGVKTALTDRLNNCELLSLHNIHNIRYSKKEISKYKERCTSKKYVVQDFQISPPYYWSTNVRHDVKKQVLYFFLNFWQIVNTE